MKRITIHEGTEPKNLAVDKLVTALTDGGEATWVPEDETQLSRLTATRNGRYRPASGFYGFSDVDVMVKGTVPTPGEHTPYQPTPDAEPESGTILMLTIKKYQELSYTPRVTIGNTTGEGVVSMVDFSNATLECTNPNAFSGSYMRFNNTSLYNKQGQLWNRDGSVLIGQYSDRVEIHHTGRFMFGGSEFFMGTGNPASQSTMYWRVGNVSFKSDDTYAFTITIYLNSAE